MKRLYKEPSIKEEQVLGTDALLLVNSSFTGQEGTDNPSVSIEDGEYDGPAASKGDFFGSSIWE